RHASRPMVCYVRDVALVVFLAGSRAAICVHGSADRIWNNYKLLAALDQRLQRASPSSSRHPEGRASQGRTSKAEHLKVTVPPTPHSPPALLRDLFDTAVATAHPRRCLPAHLPAPPERGRLLVLAAGKAAGSMAEVAEAHYLDTLGLAAGRLHGLAVARHGYGRPTRVVRMIEAGHPVPDEAGLAATADTL